MYTSLFKNSSEVMTFSGEIEGNQVKNSGCKPYIPPFAMTTALDLNITT
jgi:hypothetical protein